ncbi:hypothetical protein LFT45_01250 [Arthrobacter sp. FW305-BF8]|uniref:hypothetical protein n=1 Tax=Arthrobacter sp. FW305-BF8 TaxID=2879617 RepID=UPI001F342FEB|nr:hypothetical protein [Arthrobacter sp. FW305-BF8]UKA54622.1 hypothetical protein LFT45_01250 [Arthrobacter sp. FW305-BF8]
MTPLRSAYVHLATVTMDAAQDGMPAPDTAALSAAVTLELCGSWDHPPPCPLAPHHTRPEQNGDIVTLRIIFATEPANEALVRSRIDGALRRGSLTGPDGRTSHWALLGGGPGMLDPSETEHARRLTDS